MVIYKATNLLNGKVYVGQTVRTLDERMREHLRHNETAFSKALKKYGIENFEINVIDKADTVEELNEKEIFWIKFFKAFGENGYNMCEGGGNTTGYHHTEKSKEKMSIVKKTMYTGEGNPFYNKKHTAVSKAKMSNSRKGRIITPEWRKNIAEGAIHKRKVKNIETGEVFNSIKEAAEKYNILPTHITRVCKGKRAKTGGYHWEYIESTS